MTAEDMPFDTAPHSGSTGISDEDSPFDAAPMGYKSGSPNTTGSAGTAASSCSSSSSSLPPPPGQTLKWDAHECLQDLNQQASQSQSPPRNKPPSPPVTQPVVFDPIESAKMFEKEKMAASNKPASSSLLSKVAAVASKTAGRPPVTSANNSSSAYAFKRSESYDTAELIRKYGKYSQAAQSQAGAAKPSGPSPSPSPSSGGVPFTRSHSTTETSSPTQPSPDNVRSQALKVLDLVDDRWKKPVDVRRTESGGFRASSYSMQRSSSNVSNSSGRHVPTALSGLGMATGEASMSLSSPHDHNGGERIGSIRPMPHVSFGGVKYDDDDEQEDDIFVQEQEGSLVDVVQMENRAAGRFSNRNHNKMEGQFVEEDISDHDDGSDEHSDSNGSGNKSSWSARYAHKPKTNDPRLSKMLDNMDREHNQGSMRVTARNMFASSAYDNRGHVQSPVKGNGRVFGAGFSFRNPNIRQYRDVDDPAVEDNRNLNASVYRDVEDDGGAYSDHSPPVHKTWQATQQKRRRRRQILVLLLCLLCLAAVIGTLTSLLHRSRGSNDAVASSSQSSGGNQQVINDQPSEDFVPDDPIDVDESENIIDNDNEGVVPAPAPVPEFVPAPIDEGTSFYVTSDVPYDLDATVKLATDLVALDPAKADFLVHLGNVQDDSQACPAEKYKEVADLLVANSPLPVFVTPGSQDWAICPLPQASFGHWAEAFGTEFEEQLKAKYSINRRTFRLQDREENFALLHDGVLFMGMHLVTGDYNAEQRQEDMLTFYFGMLNFHKGKFRAMIIFGNAKPTPEHQAFFGGVATSLESIGVPVAYMHANRDDRHDVLKYKPFDDMPTMLAIEVANGGRSAPLRATVARDLETADDVFTVHP